MTLRARLRERLGDLLTPIELRETDPDEDAAESALAGADAARLADQLKQQRDDELAQINEALEEILPEAFASVREAMVRALGKRHYDVQLMGGVVLHRGAIAEMRTGEGKTFVGAAGRLPERRSSAAACTWSPSTTTWPSATRSGSAPSSIGSG